MSNTVELFRLRTISTDTVCRSRLSREGIDQELRMIKNLGLDPETDFAVESEGLFTYREVTTIHNSMSQSDIDNGGDNDPYELTHRIYTPVNN